MLKYEIIFFANAKHSPVEEFISSLSKPTIAKTLRLLDLLGTYGPPIGMPYVKKITADLFELRIRGQEEVRILFSMKKNILYLLHVFKKKQMKIPSREIETAQKRLQEI